MALVKSFAVVDKKIVCQVKSDISLKSIFYEFELFKQRHTKEAVASKIVDHMVYVFNKNEDLFKNYIAIRKYYLEKGDVSIDKFLSILKSCLINDELKSIAEDYITDHYVPYDKEYKKYNVKLMTNEEEDDDDIYSDLSINEAQILDLQKIAFVIKFIIPIVSDYFYHYNLNDDDNYFNAFIQAVYLFNDNDIESKLKTFTIASVKRTKFSDGAMWNKLNTRGMSDTKVIVSMFEMFISTILFKLVIEQYPVNFISVTLKSQVNYKFSVKFDVNFNTNSTTLITKMDNNLNKKDEGLSIISEVNKNLYLYKLLPKEFNISVDDNEVDYYMENININHIHRQLISVFFAKYISLSTTNLTKREYIILLIYIKKYLESNKYFALLSNLIFADVILEYEKLYIKKNVLNRVTESKLYNKILNKYSSIKTKINDDYSKNPIFIFISFFYNKFNVINDYNVDNTVTKYELNFIERKDLFEDLICELLLLLHTVL